MRWGVENCLRYGSVSGDLLKLVNLFISSSALPKSIFVFGYETNAIFIAPKQQLNEFSQAFNDH